MKQLLQTCITLILRSILLLTPATSLIGCHEHTEIVEEQISTNFYNFRSDALKTGDSLKIIYCSNIGDRNDPVAYLIQIVAIKRSTGDTVNILCTHSNHINKDDGDKVFYYEPLDDMGKTLVSQSDSIFSRGMTGDSMGIAMLGSFKIKMVKLDPKYKAFSENKFPTVYGEIK